MNLEQLHQHPSFPFDHFKENDLEFLLLEMFWIELFRSCIGDSQQIEHWKALYPAEKDASPILVMANSTLNRAIYVKLRINDENRPLYPAHYSDLEDIYFLPFDLWLDEIYDSRGEKSYVGLVISTEMSTQALKFAEKAMHLFCQIESPIKRTQEVIDNYYQILKEKGYHWR